MALPRLLNYSLSSTPRGRALACDGGNIILGGDEGDIITGRGGDDLIDGDARLNARISVRANTDGTDADNKVVMKALGQAA